MPTAIFVDLENIVLPAWMTATDTKAKVRREDIRAKAVTRELVSGILDQADDSIMIRNTYGSAKSFRGQQRLTDAGFKHVHVSGAGTHKNASDIHMTTDIMQALYTKDFIDRFVIVSGDSDFAPVMHVLAENNKCVVAIGNRKTPRSVKAIARNYLDIAEFAAEPTAPASGPALPAEPLPSASPDDLMVRAWFLAVPPTGTQGEPQQTVRKPAYLWRLLSQLAQAHGMTLDDDMAEFYRNHAGDFRWTEEEIVPTDPDALDQREDAPYLTHDAQSEIAELIRANLDESRGRATIEDLRDDLIRVIGPRLTGCYGLYKPWNLAAYLNLYARTIRLGRTSSGNYYATLQPLAEVSGAVG
ncbi:NYN domain-containing protein [Skermania piniformis]|uniref:NYN domain-containing protein n=1 Tax=Skermania pinensis TaxID=39122 RepID=A0ABX8S9C0_9ACTN|nr:NYN domain-containing protein [Skermania piniformis]QXQ14368.1 NYN domain-containing protein [Skermania piniformis]